jgi:two-component system, cell cycle sensor histidine kinase and response regulator CckA
MTADAGDPKGRSSSPGQDDGLRVRAEARAGADDQAASASDSPLSVEEAREVLHDLRVHQIEIEMQNEELRRTQHELEASRERYFQLYDLAPVAYLTIGEGGRILEVNLTAVSLLGQDRSDLVGRPFTRFIQPESQDTFYRHRKTLVETGSTQTCELEMLRAEGTAFVGRVASTAAIGPGGERVSRVIVSDVTELRAEEARRLKLENRLHQAEKGESLGRMAGAISHHFNNLLSVVIGNLELVLSDLPPPAERDGPLDDALSAARSAAQVSGMLLSYVGQADEEQAPRDLSEIIGQSLPILRATLPSGRGLEGDLPSPGPTVNLSVGQIRKVLENLVTNAWEAAGADNDAITVSVREVSAGAVPTIDRFPPGWSPTKGRYAVLSVTDRGSGIDRRHVEQIFDPFFSGKEYGRGLGLSVALGAVKAHDGAIAVIHPPGGGTTMEVYLPVADDAAIVEVAPRAPAPPRTTERVVLLVDDEAMLRAVGRRMLSRLGYEVLTAGDGIEALDVFDEHLDRITCVVCDLTMPRMTGWETLKALRERRPGLPVVLTSGFDETYAMAGDHPERPQVFMSKPWSGARPQAAIERAIG